MTCESTLRDTLERERIRIQKELNAYPAPIAGCDAYFNDLLEQRTRICDQLSKLSEPEAAC